jgi:hypothetical protein
MEKWGVIQSCIPPSATLQQLTEIVKKYLEDNPEKWHFRLSGTFIIAINTAFPCKE